LILREGKRTQDRMVMLTVSGNPEYALKRTQINSLVDAVKGDNVSVFLRIQQTQKGSPTQFYEMHLHGPDHIREELNALSFKISPTSFFQPNTCAAEKLYARALELCTLHPDQLVFDLYCGTATLGMICARQVKKVIGIELNPHAVFDAKSNMEHNQIKNMEIHCGDVGKLLKERQWERPDLVILDPPRAGLDAVAIAHVIALNPKQILYVSCNPATQAENIKKFIESGYLLKEIQPVDQFPHTMHIENIALLLFP
jgi:23S rRNA (uracil1939-C5)-methyltransferase